MFCKEDNKLNNYKQGHQVRKIGNSVLNQTEEDRLMSTGSNKFIYVISMYIWVKLKANR